MPTVVQQTRYCPRCDRPFKAKSRILAWKLVLEHVKRAHPDYIDMMEDM